MGSLFRLRWKQLPARLPGLVNPRKPKQNGRKEEHLLPSEPLLVGLTGTVVNPAIYGPLQLGFHGLEKAILLIPATIAREVSILWNCAWNDVFTF